MMPAGRARPAPWANGNVAHFASVAGIVAVSGTVSFNTALFETTGYTLQTAHTTDTLGGGPIILGENVNLFVHDPSATASRTFQMVTSFSGGTGSGLTIQGAQTGGESARIVLSSDGSFVDVRLRSQ
jgi:hypothetical protein